MYAVIGGDGFLGSYLIKNIIQRTDEKILASTRNKTNIVESWIKWIYCDMTDDDSLRHLVSQINIEQDVKIIYLPAYFNTSKQYDRDIAWNINILSYAKFISMLEKFDRFYSVSTDMLFSQDSDMPYGENAVVSPLNDYAKHKLAEEAMATAAGVNIVRLSVMMGKSLAPHKKHFFDEIIEQNRKGASMKFFTDSWRSIIDFNSVAKAILGLVASSEAAAYPIVNISGDEALSKYEMALRMAEHYRLDKSKILPVSMDEDTEIWQEKRPRKILLDNSLVKKLLHLNEMKFSFNDF